MNPPKKPGRPVTNSVRRAVYLAPDVDAFYMAVPKNKRSQYITQLVRADMKKKASSK